MYPENPEETQIIVGSMNLGYIISDTADLIINGLKIANLEQCNQIYV